jgi:pimeloyl-ACP methyl ester carboxylesterase
MWSYRQTGAGRPLILLHGIGMSHAAWNPMMPHLHARRVTAFDIAGFGDSPSLPDGTPPTIANLVSALERSLEEIGIRLPVDVAGNSLGGTMALEAARRGVARKVVAISPAGLWARRDALHVRPVFSLLRFMAVNVPGAMKSALRRPWSRELALAVPFSAGSRRMPVDDALRAVDDLARAQAFEQTFENTRSPFAGHDISVPVTVAFGDRDWILTQQSRCRNQLPAHTTWISKRGWGHVPMWIDPAGVAELILSATQ